MDEMDVKGINRLRRLINTIEKGKLVYSPLLNFDIDRARPITFEGLTHPDLEKRLTRAGINGYALEDEDIRHLIDLVTALRERGEKPNMDTLNRLIEEKEESVLKGQSKFHMLISFFRELLTGL